MITQDLLRERLSYDPDTGVFTWLKRKEISRHDKRWNTRYEGTIAGYLNGGTGYREINIDGRQFQAHRLAWLYVHGTWPAALIDHINGVRDDNRIANLREATKSQNGQNRGKQRDNTSGFKGVFWRQSARKWFAKIVVSRRQIYLGHYDCPAEASRAYEAGAAKYHGDFSRTE